MDTKKIKVLKINGRIEPRPYQYNGKSLNEFSYFADVEFEGKKFSTLLKHSSEKIDQEIGEGKEYNAEKKEYQGQAFLKISRIDAGQGGGFQRKGWTPPAKYPIDTLTIFAGKCLDVAKTMAGKQAENPEVLHKFFDTILRTFSVSCDMAFGGPGTATGLEAKVQEAAKNLDAMVDNGDECPF
jgi:hypothetical protein